MATALRELAGPWRFDDLPSRVDLPDGCKAEVVDGHLVVTPPPAHVHQFAVAALLRQLAAAAPADWIAVPDLGLRLGTDGRVPDISVVSSRTPDGAGPYPRGPEYFGLVIEIVSPSSRKTDLFAKPGEYAEAGIPLFWRVDLEDVVRLHAFALQGTGYQEVAVVEGAGDLPVPWGSVRIDLTTLPDR